MKDNMKIYNQARTVPVEACKSITAGRLKGMTDINPMYRIKRLTEMFGACGVGWWYEVTDKQIIFDEITNQKIALVDVLLFYVDPESGKESHGIPGTGGAACVAQERNGPYLSDECYKMALTDAISVAAKALGVAADIYWQKDRTKYPTDTEDEQTEPEKPNPEQSPRKMLIARLHELNIDVNAYAKANNLNGKTDNETFMRLLKELENA